MTFQKSQKRKKKDRSSQRNMWTAAMRGFKGRKNMLFKGRKLSTMNKNSSLESLREEYQQRLDEVGSLSLRKRRRSPAPGKYFKRISNLSLSHSHYFVAFSFFLEQREIFMSLIT